MFTLPSPGSPPTKARLSIASTILSCCFSRTFCRSTGSLWALLDPPPDALPSYWQRSSYLVGPRTWSPTSSHASLDGTRPYSSCLYVGFPDISGAISGMKTPRL
jgi:hypothetical protein